jgi:hypothetical protein
MALIGTISGSVGAGSTLTSTTAISGTLVIADSPASSFPVLSSGVKLFVSGNKTSLGADTPNSIFGGDAFVSGAFGTDSYIQMKPVGVLRIPTNTTASYIYTSGSTNDLYFTQYNGPYTNTTRLRWLEAALGTGLLSGGTLSSTSGSTTYNIASGSGLIVTYNAHSLVSITDQTEPYPVITRVEWPNLNSQALPSISTTQITYVGVDSTGTPYLKSTPFVNGDFDNYISLGRILHTDKVGTNGAVNQPTVSYGQTHFRGDFVRSFGPIKLSGHTFYASGSQGLKKDAGDSYAEGRNYTTDPDTPNYVSSTTDTAQLTSKIFYQYINASGDDVILNNGNLGFSALDSNTYINAGAPTTVGAGNKFTIQRVFWFPNAVNRAFYVYYGTVIYSTIADAQAGIGTEVFVEGKNTKDGAIFLGYVIAQGVTLNFADPTTYKIIQAGSFRAVASSGAGATGTPGGANTYVQFNDASVFNGTNDFRFDKTTGTALVGNLIVTGTSAGSLVTSGTFQVKGGSGTVVGSISTGGVISGSGDLQIGGNITGSNLYLAGDIAVIGGDLTTTAATFNLATNLATQLNVGGTTPTISVGTSTGTSTTGIATGTNTVAATIKSVNIGTGTGAAATVNINIGSSGSLGRTTLNNDVALTTGNIIGAPGTGANVMTLISSGNIVAKLDTDNSAPGHKFAVVDSFDVDQFRVYETGNAEVRGDLIITGSSIVTTTSGTFNLLNTTLTGTLNIGGAATSIFMGSNKSTGTMGGDFGVAGRTGLGGISERLTDFTGASTIVCDMIQQSIFYVNNPSGAVTANFTNVPTVNNRVLTPTVILSQSATPRVITTVQIDGAGQTINWANNVTPTGNANKQDVFGFSLIRSGSAWKVLGQMSTYG